MHERRACTRVRSATPESPETPKLSIGIDLGHFSLSERWSAEIVGLFDRTGDQEPRSALIEATELENSQCVDLDPCTVDRCSLGTCTHTPEPQCVAELGLGSTHSCARRVGGEVACWGSDNFGQLGIGTVSTEPTLPTRVSTISDAVEIALGSDFTCARCEAMATSCWGRGRDGQLGNGMVVDSSTPRVSMVPSDATAIAAGFAHACALRAGGAVVCWGRNTWGELGSGSTVSGSPVPVVVSGLTDATSIAAGGAVSCAVRRAGTAVCWGANAFGQVGDGTTGTIRRVPAMVAGLTDAQVVEVSGQHSCAIRAGGTVVCWGANDSGQLGDGTTVNSPVPLAVSGLVDATALALSVTHSCALRATGAVVCWGDNASGQLGDGSLLPSRTPVEVSATDLLEVRSGANGHSCARGANGTVLCWGYNSIGQVGDGTRANHATPVEVGL